jgi:uncharacterized membrane protein
MWFLFALLSAVLASFRKVNDKHLSHAVHHMHLAWMTKIAVLPILALTAIFTGQLIPEHSLPLAFWLSMFACTFITAPIDTAVYLHSLKHGQLSKTAPLMTLWPVVMLVTGALFLQQTPSLGAVAAITLIVLGVYILNVGPENRNVFKNIWHDRGTRFGLIGVGTVSLNTTLGAIAVVHSEPLFCAFWATAIAVPVQFTYAQLVARGKYRHPPIKLIAQSGTIQGTATALYFSAVATGPIGYVTAVRSLSAPLSAVVGAKAFNEGMNKRKISAITFITFGALLLARLT